MPALVNSKVGSFAGTKDDECTSLCPFCTKKSRNLRRISEPVSMVGSRIYSSIGCVGGRRGRADASRSAGGKRIPRRLAPRNDKRCWRGRTWLRDPKPTVEMLAPGRAVLLHCVFGLLPRLLHLVPGGLCALLDAAAGLLGDFLSG